MVKSILNVVKTGLNGIVFIGGGVAALIGLNAVYVRGYKDAKAGKEHTMFQPIDKEATDD